MTIGSPASALAANQAIAPVAPWSTSWPGPKTDVKRTTVAASGMEPADDLAEALGQRVLVRRRLDRGPDRRGIDEPRAVLGTALEQVEGRARVLAHGAGRVGARARRVGNAREVEDGGAALDQRACTRRIARVERPGQLDHLVSALAETA